MDIPLIRYETLLTVEALHSTEASMGEGDDARHIDGRYGFLEV